jgi:hypothetical protein
VDVTAGDDDSPALLVGHVRVSSVGGRTDGRFKSPEPQRDAMERWANGRDGPDGHRRVGWFEDLDRSGVPVDRPKLKSAEEAADSDRRRSGVL